LILASQSNQVLINDEVLRTVEGDKLEMWLNLLYSLGLRQNESRKE
jgi:hypothetical protein